MAQATAHPPLYRTARHAVICAGLAFVLAHLLFAQRSAGTKKPTGPRALGLLEIAPSGKVTLLPVTIMIDGEFYDASAYKASPVPLALYTDTVYEGVKTGVSQGLFTVTTAQHGETIWRGLGKWQSADSIAAAEARKKASAAAAERAKKVQDNSDGPPVLKRPSAAEPSPAASAPPPAAGPSSDDPYGPPTLKRPNADPSPSASTASSAPPVGSPAPGAPAPGAPAPGAPASGAQTQASGAAPAPSAPPQANPPSANDPNLPTLRRGKAAAAKEEAREAAASDPTEPAAVKASAARAPGKQGTVTMTATATSNGLQLIPAISDAAGPDPRPYAYSMKPEEEAKLRDKMLALAAIEVRGRAKDLGLATSTTAAAASAASSSGRNSPHARAAKPPQPKFDTVQLRVFDLSNNNEPVLVLTANARLPQTAKGALAAADVQYIVTLVAREDIYGDLHKAYSNVTDAQHLDVLPQMEFIDAVDADGDGRGELLFRQVSDSGRAFVVYRVIGDQVWPLFQGKLG